MFDWQALWVTVRLASAATAVLLLIALPLSYAIVFWHTRWRVMLEAVVALPLVLPPTVLGFYLLVGLGPLTAVGRTVTALLGHTLAFSFTGLVVGSVVYSLPFAVQPLVAGLRTVPRPYLHAAATLGASPMQVYWRIALPLAKASLLAAAVLTFAHTVGEFGVVLMLGGSLPGQTKTLSISLYDLVEGGNFAAANRIALAMMLASTAALVLLYIRPWHKQRVPR